MLTCGASGAPLFSLSVRVTAGYRGEERGDNKRDNAHRQKRKRCWRRLQQRFLYCASRHAKLSLAGPRLLAMTLPHTVRSHFATDPAFFPHSADALRRQAAISSTFASGGENGGAKLRQRRVLVRAMRNKSAMLGVFVSWTPNRGVALFAGVSGMSCMGNVC